MKNKKAPSKSAVAQPKLRTEPQFQGYVTIPLQMPPKLAKWADNRAFHLQWFLSDYIVGLLGLEKCRDEKGWVSHMPAEDER